MGVTGTNITLTLRNTKGVALTYAELDANMSGLEAAIEGHSHDDFSLSGHNHDGEYEPVGAVDAAVAALQDEKQDTLISGTNIKTINSTSILGSGNIVIEGGGADIPYQNDAPSNPSDGDLWVDKDAVAPVANGVLPFYTASGTRDVVPLTVDGLIPFYKSSGSASNIALASV